VVISSNCICLATYKGLNETNMYSRGYFWGSVTNSITQCILVWVLKDSGVAYALVVSAFMQLLVQIFFLRAILNKYSISVFAFPVRIRKKFILAGLRIGGAKALTASLAMVSQFMLLFLLAKYSVNAMAASYFVFNGVITQISNLVLVAVSGAFFPALMKLYGSNRLEFSSEIRSQTQFIIRAIFPLLLGLLIFQDFVITTLTNESFATNGFLFTDMVCAAFLATAKQSFDLSLFCHRSNKYFLFTSCCGALTIVSVPFAGYFLAGDVGFGAGLIVHGMFWYFAIPLLSMRVYGHGLGVTPTQFLWFVICPFCFIAVALNLESISISIQLLIFGFFCCLSAFGQLRTGGERN
jgi:O-antigen/teichoic acid export membrane protein